MKKGYTTGSCAAAAAKAAAYMLLSGKEKHHIEIETPSGEKYCPDIEEILKEGDTVSCAVRKESGDDPDVTRGVLIFATLSFSEKEEKGQRVIILGGKGVGRVTRPGLDQPVGEAAINSVPRQMIIKEVTEVMDLFDYEGSLKVEISVPEGEALAEKTFNPRLGIEGGISIIGTTGIVEPMSTKALLDTIMVELRQKKAMGNDVAVITPGNYGEAFMKEKYGFDLERAVKCSNFIGDTIDMAVSLGYEKVLLCGHIGKLIKVSGGIMNTHSKEGDCRMELLAAAAMRSGADSETFERIMECLSTEEAIEIYKEKGIDVPCFSYIMDRIGYYLNKRAAGQADVQCMMYSSVYGLLGETDHAEEYLKEAMKG